MKKIKKKAKAEFIKYQKTFATDIQKTQGLVFMIHKEFFQQPKANNMILKCTKELHRQSLQTTYNNNQQGNGKVVKDSTGLMPFMLIIHYL